MTHSGVWWQLEERRCEELEDITGRLLSTIVTQLKLECVQKEAED